MTFSVTSNRLPDGTGTNCMVQHVLHHTMHCTCAFLNRGRTFVCGLIGMLMRRVNTTFPRLPTRRRLVAHIVGRRRSSFLHALRGNVGLLGNSVSRLGTRNRARLSNMDTFHLFSACNFPLSLARLVYHRGNCAMSTTNFSRRVGGRGRHTHGTTTMRGNS